MIEIQNNILNKTKGLKNHLVVGEPIVSILNNDFYDTDKMEVTGDQKYTVENVWNLAPEFNEGTPFLMPNSNLSGKGTDGLNLGVITKKL